MTERIRLSYEGMTAEIQREGAQIASFRLADGVERIWQADPQVWAEHAPVLFPVCGAPLNGQVEIDGVSYPMPKHGITRHNPLFSVARQGKDFVDLVLEDSEATRASYPFAFALHVIYTLYPNGYRTTFLVENRDQKVMPFCIGGHPAFNCPMEDGAAFVDYDVLFEKEETGCIACFPDNGPMDGEEKLPFMTDGRVLPLRHEEIDPRDSWLFTAPRSRSIRLVNRNTGKGLEMHFPKIEALAIWSAVGKYADYICLEPWHGIPAAKNESGILAEKPYATSLQPGESYVTWFDVTWCL